MGNLWLVKFNGLILQPMDHTNHKFPVTALLISQPEILSCPEILSFLKYSVVLKY